jgi:hypothetical protein
MIIEYQLSAEELLRLRGHLPPYPAAPIEQKPFNEWPTWAVTVSSWRTSADGGVGDTIHRKLGVMGKSFTTVLKAVGVECGCDRRQAEYNTKYPYSLLTKQT